MTNLPGIIVLLFPPVLIFNIFCITLLPVSVSFAYYFSLSNKLKIQQNSQTNKQTNKKYQMKLSE